MFVSQEQLLSSHHSSLWTNTKEEGDVRYGSFCYTTTRPTADLSVGYDDPSDGGLGDSLRFILLTDIR